MPAVPVEYVQQRAGEEEHEGQELHHVGTVLGEQEIAGNQNESQEHPPTRPAAETGFVHRQAADRRRSTIHPNTAPNTNAHTTATKSAKENELKSNGAGPLCNLLKSRP